MLQNDQAPTCVGESYALEPGDGTHYEVTVVPLGLAHTCHRGTDDTYVLVAMTGPLSGAYTFACRSNSLQDDYFDPSYVAGRMFPAYPWARASYTVKILSAALPYLVRQRPVEEIVMAMKTWVDSQ
jgi:hypothetical protein